MDFKASIWSMFKNIKEKMKKNEWLDKESDRKSYSIPKNHMQILWLKRVICKMKNSLYG